MTKDEFDELRRSAFAIAYRMLGSVGEAEDVVQEGLLRLHRARESGEEALDPSARGLEVDRDARRHAGLFITRMVAFERVVDSQDEQR